MPVTVQSRARRMQVFHLPHEVFCRGQCACTEVTVVVVAENSRTGERAPKQLRKKIAGSITLLALERKAGLPAAVLELAEVKAAIGRGYLRVVEQTPDDAALPSAEMKMPGSREAPMSAPAGSSAAPASSAAPSAAPATATTAVKEA
jgi:hypothetical protein